MGNIFRASLLILFVDLISQSVPGQMPAPPTGKPIAPGLIKLTGEDEKRAKELDEQIEKAVKADRWDEAIARAQELLALRTRAQGSKHFETMNAEWQLKALRRVSVMPKDDRAVYQSARSMSQQSATLDSEGKYAQAEPLLRSALEVFRRLLSDNHPFTAASYNNLAENLNSQGKYGAAQPLLEKSLEIFERLVSDAHPDTAGVYSNLAFTLNAQGKFADAQPLFEKALAICRRLLTDDHPLTATCYQNLAYNLNAQGKYSVSQPLCEKALDIKRRLLTDDDRSTAISYMNLASTLEALGNYALAQPIYEKALDIQRRVLGDDHPETAIGYNNLALNLNTQGKFIQAQVLFEKALEIERRMLSDDHPNTAGTYNNLGYCLGSQGKHAAAQVYFEKALAIKRRLLTDEHPDTAFSYSNLGGNLDAQGKFAEAQPYLEKALEIKRRVLTDDHRDTADGYRNLAGTLNARGKFASAQSLLEKALEIDRRLLGDDHPDTALCYKTLGYSLEAQGKYLEAQDRLICAVRSLDKSRLRLAFAGLERGGTGEPVRPTLAAVLARLDRWAEAWQQLEEDLARGLLDELAARQDRRLVPIRRTELKRLITELDRLDGLLENAPKALDQAQRAKRFADSKRRRELASIALGEFQSKLVDDYGAVAGKTAGLSEIQATMAVDVALVAWIDAKPTGPGAAAPDGEHWGVVVRAKGNPVWARLSGTGTERRWTPEDTELLRMVRGAFRQRPDTTRADATGLGERFRAQRLAPLDAALGPTADGLPRARRLIVLASRAMAAVPVEALLASDDPRTVSYAPSATVLTYLRNRPKSDDQGGLLALGDPVFELSRPATVAVQDRRRINQSLISARSGSEHFARLPGTRYEVATLARIFESAQQHARVLTGGEATEQVLDHLASSGDLSRFTYIHLATHGVIDEAIPQRSAVILTQTGLPDPLDQVLNHKPVFDGRLSVREIQRNWNLKAELVTLSACETAGGRYAGGEGFVGFTQALLMSGARSVCLSLWKVDDTATALFMTRFYQNMLGKRPGLSKPMPKAEALGEAKKWLRRLTRDEADAAEVGLKQVSRGEVRRRVGTPVAIHPYEHPHFWAAFVLMGDPD